MVKSAQKIDNLKQNMSALEKIKTPTAEYKEIQKQISGAEKKQTALNDRMDKFLALGGKEDSKTFKSMQYDAEQLENEIKYAKRDLQNLIDSGKAFTFGTDTDKYADLSRQLEAEQNNLNSLSQKYQEYQAIIAESASLKENATVSDKKLVALLEEQKALQEQINQLKQAGVGEGYKEYDKAASDLARVNEQIEQQRTYVGWVQSSINALKMALGGLGSLSKKAFSGIGSLAKKGASGVLSLGKAAVKGISSFAKLQKFGINALKGLKSHSKSAGGMMGSFGNRVLGLAKRVFVFSLITKRFRAMFSGMKEGFQNYLAYDANLKNSVEGLKASLNTVKANLGAAFAPIVQTVLPYLQMLIGWLNTAINAVNQFISSILGRTTYKRAASGVGNISNGVGEMADNMGEAAQQAKKLEKALAHYDELNVIQKNDDSGTSGSGSKTPTSAEAEGLGIGYEDVAIDSKIKAMADKIKKYLSDIFKPMKASWDKYGQSVINSWKKALTNIMELLKVVANTFRDVWTNGTGEKVCSNILLILKMIGDIIASIARAFINAWNDNNRGYNYIQSIFNRLNSILSLIRIIGQSLLTVWNNGSGEQIIGHLLEIFTNINNAIANIRNNFAKAWKLDDTGTKIIQDLADLCNILLGHINNITKGLEKWTKELDFSPLLKAFNNVTTALKPLGDKVGAGLEWLFVNILQPLAKWALESFIPKALDAIASALDALDTLLEAVKPIFSWLLDNFLNPLAEWTGGLIMDILGGLTTAFEGLHDVFQMIAEGKDWEEIGKFIWQGIINGITGFVDWAWTKVQEAFWGIVNFVKDLLGIHSPSTVFEELGRYCIQGLVNGLASIPGNLLTILKGVWNKIQSAWKSLGNLVLEIGAKLKQTAKDLWDGIKAGWAKITSKVVEITASIKQKASDLWNSIKTAWDNAKNKVLEVTAKLKQSASELWEGFKTNWGNLRDTAVNVVVGIKEAAVGIWDKITGLFTGKKSETKVDETINVGTKLVKSGWTTLSKFIGDSVNVKVSLKKGFSSLAKFIGEKTTVKISLGKSGWSSVSKFIGTTATVNISLKKKGWSSIEKFVGTSVTAKISLKKSGWKDIKSFVGTAVTVSISLRRSGWKDIKSFIGTSVQVSITLKKSGWSEIKNFIGTAVTVDIKLNLVTKLSSIIPDSKTVYVNLSGRNSLQSIVPNWVEVAVYFYAARSVQSLVPSWVEVPTYFYRRANGGVYQNGRWSDIPQFSSGGIINSLKQSITRFASGGSAMGTLFYAGEAGPEIVGNAGGGRSEVLNKSQIASAIYSAVVAGIMATLGNFTAVMAATVQSGSNDITAGIDGILGQLESIQNSYYTGTTIPPVNYIPDVNRINSYTESISRTNTISADNTKLINALAEKINGNCTIENIMYLDGKIVYQDMVEIDKMTAKQTGKSGFAY